jgi:uncharacterized membrane protein YhaH (DUF805 family)
MSGAAMNFWQAITSGFRNYVTFSGRALRSEYWYWVLFTVLATLAAGILDAAVFPNSSPVSPLTSVFDLATFLPGLAVGIRRLHDIDRTGWWVLLVLTIIGTFVLIYWACKRGTPGPNRYGPNPYGTEGHIGSGAAG